LKEGLSIVWELVTTEECDDELKVTALAVLISIQDAFDDICGPYKPVELGDDCLIGRVF